MRPQPTENPLVVAVVLTWNDTSMTRDCLASLIASDYPNLHVVLVDNGSDAPCGEQLQEEFPAIDLLVLSENRGFAVGSNTGMDYALSLGADYVHLVGNDSVLERSAVSQLVCALQEHPETGGAGPLLMNPGPERTVQFYKASLDRDCMRHTHHHLNEPHSDRDWPTVHSQFIPFVALMFRATALREVGLMDESFGTSWEDVDLNIRLADRGWPLLTVGGAEAVHLGSATTGKISPYITYFMVRNRLECLRRHGCKSQILRRLPFLLRTFWWQIREYGLGNLRCHAAVLRGLVHFALGVRGERSGLRNSTAELQIRTAPQLREGQEASQ